MMNTRKTTFSVIFYVKKTKKLQNGQVPIFARITWNGSRSEFSVKRSIEPHKWLDEAGIAAGRDTKSVELNRYLDAYKGRAFKAQAELLAEGVSINAMAIKNRIFGMDSTRHMVVEQYELHNKKLAQGVGVLTSPNTLLRHQTTKSHLQHFIRKQYNKMDMPIEDVNHQFILDFEQYLRVVRKCNNNSAVKYLRNFKKIINIAFHNGWIQRNPFMGSRMRIEPVEKPYLTLKEIESIHNLNLTIPRLKVTRDVFLFCCFTGLAFIDVMTLTWDHLKTDDQGRTWIEKERQKTKIKSTVPLLPQAQKILEGYTHGRSNYSQRPVLPVQTNQKMNSYLKEIADLAGISKVLTTHIARHTFATLALTYGIPIEVVSKMVGHSSIKLTQLYAKVDRELIGQSMIKMGL